MKGKLMTMDWLKLRATTHGQSVIFNVQLPAGHNGLDYEDRPALVDPRTFLDNAILEYGEEAVAKILFKQLLIHAQFAARSMMENGAADNQIRRRMENWSVLDRPL
jgi:hypothetical protein